MKKTYIRSMIHAATGYNLVNIDLSQAESWIVAYSANERNMKQALQFGDIHTESAGNAIFHPNTGCPHVWTSITKGELWRCLPCSREVTKVMRYVGKRYNHASSYRMGPERATEVINKDSDKPPYLTITVKQSRTYSENWNNYFNLKGWWKDIEKQLSDTRTITTVYRRRRTFFAAWGDPLFKEATAYVPQSTVADHFNGAIQPELGVVGGLVEIYKQLVKPYKEHKIINQSHDSCILELPKDVAVEIGLGAMALLKRPLVINNEEFTIPVDGEIGERWGELERIAS